MQPIMNLPPVRWALKHPRLAAWIVLSAGMIALLAVEASDIGLLLHQWIALIAACILVAGACIWIVSWEDDDETASAPAQARDADQSAEQSANGSR
ncbi:MAG: hypothetical protein ACUVS2_06360 [Candidatus Flexifilum sp.]|jgi:hypothetical protein